MCGIGLRDIRRGWMVYVGRLWILMVCQKSAIVRIG